jgi:5-methyltetrahydrofolate--homocysteine methyltransferase
MDTLRRQALFDALSTRIVVLDGAMGSILQARLRVEDYGGAHLENCTDNVSRANPGVVYAVHTSYLQAGADIIETNSFNGHPVSLGDFHLEAEAYDINHAAASLARTAADEYSTAGRPRFVAGAMGPTTRSITVTRNVSFQTLRDGYYLQAKALVEGGVDLLLVETCQDTRNVKSALLAIDQLEREVGFEIPVMVSGTIEPMGTMLAGQAADAFYTSIAHRRLLAVGLNCATGPEFMTDYLRTLHQLSRTRVSCYPNAGIPDEELKYLETPESFAAQLEKFVDQRWLNLIGGCCGTTPEHIKAVADMVSGKRPRTIPEDVKSRTCFSGVDLVECDDASRPLIVGERTNVIGSRAFKSLVNEEKWEEATDIARRQVRNGAQIIDVCLQQSERDESHDIPPFFDLLIGKVKAPFMIDTTDAKAIEAALTYCQGKSIINSINLEDGEEKFERVVPLVRSYGAAVVVGCIDEDPVQAQAFSRERKLAIAERSLRLLSEKYGLPPEDVLLDPLVFPCATGDANYIGGAVETIEGVRLIKQTLPRAKTVLGISNISFGLPAAAREVVNSVFLYHCTKAGLDLAIVNAEKLERFASLDASARALAENLLFNRPVTGEPEDWRQQTRDQRVALNQHHIAAITEHFRGTQTTRKARASQDRLPLDERLSNYIVEGSKDGLVQDLDRKRAEGVDPLAIINGPLMKGMQEVGRLFNNNELIVAEVLQSAEAMKAAVTHLKQFMNKSETTTRGRVVLATVKGDVHDIGKNLVEIILSNNGYEVINLGIKVPPDALIRAIREHEPDAAGLSGLLVKSAQMMVATASDFREAGIRIPLLVGGAALSQNFTSGKIAPAYAAPTFYAKDAMAGLRLLNEIQDPATRNESLRSHIVLEESSPLPPPPERRAVSAERSSKVGVDVPVPRVPYGDRRVRAVPDLADVWSYINPYMLYGRHLGFKGQFERMLAERDPKALSLYHDVEDVKRAAAGFMKVRAVWRFYEAERDGNTIHLFEARASQAICSLTFGRQPMPDGLCLSDYILPPDGPRRDSIALFVVTAGEGIRERSEAAKSAGRFLHAHALQALAIETAEGAAEWLHRRIREDWGFPDRPEMTMRERFTARYRGKRYSFGYPACPNLDDQQVIWTLLQPEEIGVTLTEGMMMDPEASVSALVFHHPDCTYFTAAIAGEPALAGEQLSVTL